MTSSKKIKWTPAVMLKRQDNIISSEYSSIQQQFTPSYEKDEVNLYWLLAMEYSKIWYQEKDMAKKIVLSAQDNDFLVRRYVKRGLLIKKKEEEKKTPFKMKRFEAITSKIKIRSKEEIDNMMSKLTENEKEDLLKEAKSGVKKNEK